MVHEKSVFNSWDELMDSKVLSMLPVLTPPQTPYCGHLEWNVCRHCVLMCSTDEPAVGCSVRQTCLLSVPLISILSQVKACAVQPGVTSVDVIIAVLDAAPFQRGGPSWYIISRVPAYPIC